MKTIGAVLLVLAFFGSLNFAATYWIRSGWPDTEIGRNAILFAACETAILGLSVLVLAFGNFWGQQTLGLLAFTAFTAVNWWRWTVLIRVQLRDPDQSGEE